MSVKEEITSTRAGEPVRKVSFSDYLAGYQDRLNKVDMLGQACEGAPCDKLLNDSLNCAISDLEKLTQDYPGFEQRRRMTESLQQLERSIII